MLHGPPGDATHASRPRSHLEDEKTWLFIFERSDTQTRDHTLSIGEHPSIITLFIIIIILLIIPPKNGKETIEKKAREINKLLNKKDSLKSPLPQPAIETRTVYR